MIFLIFFSDFILIQIQRWRDFDNFYRVHKDTQLKCVPTLLSKVTGERLGDSDCSNPEALSRFFASVISATQQ